MGRGWLMTATTPLRAAIAVAVTIAIGVAWIALAIGETGERPGQQD